MVSGASLAVQMLADGMAEQGHQVLVLTSSDKDEPYLLQEETLTVYHHRSYLNPFRVGQRYTGAAHRKNTKLLRDFAPDIIHTHDPFQFAFTSLKYARKKNIPVTITTHQLPWFIKAYLPEWPGVRNFIEKIFWGYSNWLLRKFDRVISPTHTIAGVIQQKTGVRPFVINYGIELDNFHNGKKDKFVESIFRKRFDIPLDVPILLHVGRLDVDKSVEIVVRAAARSMARSDAHLLVVGDGTEKVRLMRLCKELGIEGRSHFPGYVTSRQDLADVYRMADIFITASEIETQGIVLLEAAACGLPIVAVNATCIPEIVEHGLNGFLVAPRDVVSMADHLSLLLSDRNKARIMGTSGCSISKNFSKQKTIDEHVYLYANAILISRRYSISTQNSWQKLRNPFS